MTNLNSRTSKFNTFATYHDVEIPLGSPTNVVVAEVESFPVHYETGVVSRAVEKMNRGTRFHDHSRNSKSFHTGTDGTVSSVDPNEIVVSYDVWRTVEETAEEA
jgi:hypothetical protein